MSFFLNRCAVLAALALPLSLAAQGGVKEMEVTSDPPRDGIEQFTCRFAPAETVVYDRIEFEVLYRQDITLPLPGGGTTNRVHEPVWFKYTERNAKLVAGLDKYISFRVPVDLDKLRQTYGRKIFQVDAPVRVSTLRVTAYYQGRKAWTLRETPPGTFAYTPRALAPPRASPTH